MFGFFRRKPIVDHSRLVEQVLEPTGGKILRPEDWYYAERHRDTSYVWTLSKEDPSRRAYTTGVALQAFAEVKRSMEKADEIHKTHMGGMDKMDAAMMEKMKPMMDKMVVENAVLMMHMSMLDKALQASTPDSQEVAMHTAYLILKFEKKSSFGFEHHLPME